MTESFRTFAWFLTDRDGEIAQWVEDNLEDSTCEVSRKVDSRRSMIVYFGSQMDETLFKIRWA